MNNTKKYQTIFINSANRDNGTIGNFSINLHDRAIKCDDDNTILKISVLQLSLNKSWYTVEENTSFILNDVTSGMSVTYTIKPGYYSVTTLAAYLTDLMGGGTVFSIVHDLSQNKFHFKASKSYSFTFLENTAHLFGFADYSTTDVFNSSIELVSTQSVMMNKETTIYVHTSAPRKAYGAISNLESKDFRESTILCAITNIAAPFQNLTIDPSNSFTFFLSSKELKDFSLFVTDQNRKILNLQIDWQISLLVEHIDTTANTSEIDILSEMRDMIKMVILQQMKK